MAVARSRHSETFISMIHFEQEIVTECDSIIKPLGSPTSGFFENWGTQTSSTPHISAPGVCI